ncbi:DMT family transporter [Mesobacterium sp. TK19101]|uniref:DMT family transporter n=1 Tax=Mesobacterium hydrothermale TaxID=3111907 RepID=A0ABU6HI43_9RHOB|nr:DMT family transporter [Mesobacterium sp. TK19101]MEC3861474.1 DMT family transporter [Mesobacterium sp. TK19101]
MGQLSDNTRGALLMMASMASFAFGDTCVKATGGALPISQLLVLRGLLSTAFIAVLAWRLGALRWDFGGRDWALIALRSVSEAAAAYFFITALLHMPLANVTALLQVLPLAVTLASAVLFAEPVGWRRWLAIALGFGGMLLIVKPGADGFNAYTIYALISVVCVTIRDLSTRRMSRTVPSLMVTLAASATVLGFAGIWSLWQDWVPLTPTLTWLLLGSTVFIVGGYSFAVMVMRVGDVSFVAPFRYTGLLWAMVLGLVVFGDFPGPTTLLGAAIVVASGVYTLLRERTLRRQAVANARRT